ncbi:MAG: hypothetical protein MAG795_00267 [Candidatus Woesearchaeota archaeon]|nr:hypothetical protein [Candidatus Woesearchaeota archaeon]
MKNTLKSMSIILVLSMIVLSGCGTKEITGNEVIEPKVDNKPEVKREVLADKQFVAKTSELQPGDVLTFQIGEEDAILANFNGKFMAYYAKCPVHKLKVKAGEVDENEFACSHGTYNFDGTAKSGTPLQNNAILDIINIEVFNGNIYVS